MLYYNDAKKLHPTAIDSLTIIHNEQKFFAWLYENLKPEHAKYLEHADEGYNADSDEERSWCELGEVELAWLKDLMRGCEECGKNSLELSQFDTKSRLPEVYDFGIDYHLCQLASDLPTDFEKENDEHWVEFHYWRNGVLVNEPENPDDYDNIIQVYTL